MKTNTFIIMDLSEDFDCSPHDLLLQKLKACGLSQNALKLIKNYLSDRQQSVKLGTALSEWQNIYKGVPQGSILRPVLFKIFIIDIFNFTLYNYADDNTLSYAHHNIYMVIQNRESDSFELGFPEIK